MSASTASLPSYHYDPQESEHRLAHQLRVRTNRPAGNFVKNSKNGGVLLRLSGQENDARLPEYGRGASVEGTVEVSKNDNVQSVVVKIEGSLNMKEVAEGGTSTSSLCLDVKTLWTKDKDDKYQACPTSLPFSLTLPQTFFDGKAEYPLPPTYEEHLSGVPGFRANIDYAVSAVVNRSKVNLFGVSNTSVSTPFLYHPRSRPAKPLPAPLLMSSSDSHPGAIHSDGWASFESIVRCRIPRGEDVQSKFYIPASRIFCIAERIPFHVFFTASSMSLACFLPFTPTSGTSPNNSTRVQLMRQTSVDVRSIGKRTLRHTLPGNKTDIWKTTQIGEGEFRHDGDGPDWMAWSGDIVINQQVRIGGFKASGLTVKDYVVLSMTPPDPIKGPFGELRLVVPIRLTTDPWSGEFSGDNFGGSDYSDPSIPDDRLETQPEMNY